MDATSGTTETDLGSAPYEGSGHPAMTYTAGFTLNQAGALTGNGNTNKAVSFNGTTGVAQRQNDGIAGTGSTPALTNTAGWTLEMWIKFTSDVGGTQFRPYTVSGNPFGSGTDVCEVTVNGSNKINFGIGDGTTPDVFNTNACTSANTKNLWYYVVVETVGAGSSHLSSLKIYKNASLDCDKGAYSSTALLVDNASSYVALAATPPTATQFFPGLIDEFAIYNVTVGTNRLTVHYNAALGVARQGLPFSVKREPIPEPWMLMPRKPVLRVDAPNFAVQPLNKEMIRNISQYGLYAGYNAH